MKRIAFLSFDWNYEIMASYYEGMESFLARHSDVQLFIFNAFGQYASYEPEEGSFEVFSLCDLSNYDGLIVQGNRAWPPALRQELVDRVHALGKPVVSINYELKGAVTVGTDNYEAMYGLVERVLTDRQVARPAFVNGLSTSWEAQARYRGFSRACEHNGIKNARFYQANWEMEEGVRVAQELLSAPDELPDVIFCCNDDLAVGIQETLQAHGVKVPEDVMISGFDNREIGLRAHPRITTVDRDYRSIGETALSTLVALLDGGAVSPFVPSPVRYVLSASCGYPTPAESREKFAESLYAKNYALRQFFDVLTRFQPAVLNADSLLGVILECEHIFPEIRCPNVYLMINEDYLSTDAALSFLPYGDASLLMAHSGTNIKTGSDERHVYARFPSKDVLPVQIPMYSRLYMVFPIRHGTTCIGTLVTDGVSPAMGHGFLTIILTLLASAIEAARKREILQSVNSRLDDLYVHDHLTGLFNRFGLERYGIIAYDHLLRDFDEAQFIFVDVDWMKQINDVYGHDAGDQALRDTAEIINRATENENAFAMRYGGDEFLLISRRDLTSKLEHELAALKERVSRPYDLSLSIGASRVLGSELMTIMEAVERADTKMYEIKKARKSFHAT